MCVYVCICVCVCVCVIILESLLKMQSLKLCRMLFAKKHILLCFIDKLMASKNDNNV